MLSHRTKIRVITISVKQEGHVIHGLASPRDGPYVNIAAHWGWLCTMLLVTSVPILLRKLLYGLVLLLQVPEDMQYKQAHQVACSKQSTRNAQLLAYALYM